MLFLALFAFMPSLEEGKRREERGKKGGREGKEKKKRVFFNYLVVSNLHCGLTPFISAEVLRGDGINYLVGQ